MSGCAFYLLWGSVTFLVIAAEDQGSCGPPTRLHFAEPLDEYKSKTSFPVGSHVKYRCRPGYYGFRGTTTCLKSLKWSEVPKFCRVQLCENPGEPDNGRLIVPTDLSFGSTVHFACEEGHRLIGQSSIQCLIAGGRKVAWNGEVPLCQRIPCYPPPDIPHGKHNGRYYQNFYYGSAVTYTCDKGYPLIGKAFIYCTTKDGENGEWSGHVSCGVTPCPAPQVENGRIVAGDSGTYTYEHRVTLGCNAGYKLNGSGEISCQADGMWDPPVPHCKQAIQCPTPQRIANGKYNSPVSEVFGKGASVEYSCDPGYKLVGEARIYCTESGSWSSPAPSCAAIQCPTPQRIANGKYYSLVSDVFSMGASVEYSCEPGYKLVGEARIYCAESGSWSSPAPSCAENQVSGDVTTTINATLSLENTTSVVPSTQVSTTVASNSSSTENYAASPNGTETPGAFSDMPNVTSSPSNITSAVNNTAQITPLPTTGNETSAPSNETTTSHPASDTLLPYTSTQQPKNFSDSPITPQAGDSGMKGNITCLNIQHVTASHVICLKLNETYSCQEFKEKKGEHFKSIICKKESNECDIKLADSELYNRCTLLVEVNKQGAEDLDAFLQKQPALKELGIHYEKQTIENHKSYTRKTLTALVTSGLLLAFLGLAGYFLMKRWSWRPMGERPGEDPYIEIGNHGNTVISVASHEPSDLQDKPNLNGGAWENGTGQPTSKNGQSCKPHVVADTEL